MTMRSELGKITLDKTFEERDTLNEKIVLSLVLLNWFCVLVILAPVHFYLLQFEGILRSCWWKSWIRRTLVKVLDKKNIG